MFECYDPLPEFKEKYPDLLDERMISFGFGRGWTGIIHAACDKLQHISGVKIVQVKEKFGGLRIYVDGGDVLTAQILHEAEHHASKTCENCGSTINVTSEGSWIKTYCEVCHLKNRISSLEESEKFLLSTTENLNCLICDIRVAANCNRDFGECDCSYCLAKDKVK